MTPFLALWLGLLVIYGIASGYFESLIRSLRRISGKGVSGRKPR